MMKRQESLLGFRLPGKKAAAFSTRSIVGGEPSQNDTQDGPDLVALVLHRSQWLESEIEQTLLQTEACRYVYKCRDKTDLYAAVSIYPNAVLLLDYYWVNQLADQTLAQTKFVVTGTSNQEALHAFQLNANGFLTVPLEAEQLSRCMRRLYQETQIEMERAQAKRLKAGLTEQLGVCESTLEAKISAQQESPEHDAISLHTGKEWCYLRQSEIKWIEAAGDYMCVNTNDETLVVRSTLTDLLKRLEFGQFNRVNRSVVVNMDRITHCEEEGGVRHFAVVDDGTRLKISRRYYASYWRGYSRSA